MQEKKRQERARDLSRDKGIPPKFIAKSRTPQEHRDGLKNQAELTPMEKLMAAGDPVEVDGIVVRFERISPQRAKQLKDTMVNNRNLTRAHVEMILRQIPRHWHPFIAQGITVDWDGHVIDGGHRLQAIIEKGVSIILLVVYGADPDAYGAIDLNRTKNAAEFFRKQGEKSVSAMQSAIKMVRSAEESMRRGTNLASELRMKLSTYEHLAFLGMYRDPTNPDYNLADFEHSIQVGRRIASNPLNVLPSAATGAHFLLSAYYGTDRVNDFYHQIRHGEFKGSGDGLPRGLPSKTLRKRFEDVGNREPKPSAAWYMEALLRSFVIQAKGGTMLRYQATSRPGFLAPLPEEL